MRHLVKSVLMVILTITMMIITITPAFSEHGNYTAEVLFTVPWGKGEGEINIDWVDVDHFVLPPVPVAVSENAGLIFHNTNGCLTRYSLNGTLLAEPYFQKTLSFITISDTGGVLAADTVNLNYFDPSLEHCWTIAVGSTDFYDRRSVSGVYPSDDNNFWCVYREVRSGIRRAYRIKVFTDGTISEPTLVFEAPTQEPVTYGYVSPDGTVSSLIDMYGCKYFTHRQWIDDKMHVRLVKQYPEGNTIYEKIIHNDPDCEGIPDFFVMHTGNYFTWHGSDDGMVLTKYTYHPPE